MTNNKFFDMYCTFQKDHYSFKTAYARTNMLKNHFLPFYGDVPLERVTRADIHHIYDDMERRGLADNTIFGAYAALLSYFKLAITMGLLENNPAAK